MGEDSFVQDLKVPADIKINEFLANPDSEESSEDATNEWVSVQRRQARD